MKKLYICYVIFFIVLDLRLTKVGVQRYSFFYANKQYTPPTNVFTTPFISSSKSKALIRFTGMSASTTSALICKSP